MSSWIEEIPEDEASGKLAILYASLLNPESGQVDHILKVQSLDPGVLSAHIQFYRAVMRGDRNLNRAEREMIAVAVSRANDCFY